MPKLHIWHRYVGITSALFVIVLSVTGLLLNFTDDLELDSKYTGNDWLLDRYNISQFTITSFSLGDHTVSKASDFVYLDGAYIMHLREDLLGAVEIEDYILLATNSNLLLVDRQGEMLDEISTFSGLPEKPLGIAMTSDGFPVLRGVNTYWKSDSELIAWKPLKGPHPKWIAPTETPSGINALIQTHARSNEITLERVMLDLHSGRLFGDRWGRHVMSASAVLLIFLSITGLIIWLRKRAN